jgi:PKHD-type hydroxylase
MMMLKPRPLENWDSYCYYPGLVPADVCDRIVEAALARPSELGVVDDGGGGAKRDTSIRNNSVRWLPFAEDTRFLYELVVETMDQANRARWGFDLVGCSDSLQFTEYGADDHYGWHTDLGPGAFSTRKLSLVLQLSDGDGYKGGAFEVMSPRPNPEQREALRRRGTVIVFPSYTLHRVTPIEYGRRYSLVAWIEGPPFR